MTDLEVRRRALDAFAGWLILCSLAGRTGIPLTRRRVANLVFGSDLFGAGRAYAACGWLEKQGYIERRPGSGYRYRVTGRGWLMRELWMLTEDVAA